MEFIASLPFWDVIENVATKPWLLLALFALMTYFSEDMACIGAGIAAAKGWIPLPAAVVACGVGIWTGDVFLYLSGRFAQRTGARWKWLRKMVTPTRVARGKSFYDTYGSFWLFLSRFAPGVRLPSYIAAGYVGWSFKKFAFWLLIAVTLWAPFLVGGSYWAGEKVFHYLSFYEKWAWPILIALILALLLIVKVLLPSFTWRGRRLLLSSFYRIRRWEFWPIWAVYPPVFLAVLWQALKYRHLTPFTASNPSIPQSGIAMESKGLILDLFTSPHPEKMRVAQYLRLEENEDLKTRQSAVESWMAHSQLDYPIVMKPDLGERGKGVKVIRHQAALNEWLHAFHGESIAQEFIGGLEFGLHWSKSPSEAKGQIRSLSQKVPQFLTGDGTSTLEELILNDPRAVMMAPYYLEKYGEQLSSVLPSKKRFSLVEIGTHARGAVFTDERDLLTLSLAETVEAFSSKLVESNGIGFGRYDLKVPSLKDLQQGKGLVILEMNGVTGEPAHIYQPGYSYFRGMWDLCSHWNRACKIGAEYHSKGSPTTPLRAILHTLKQHRSHSWLEADDLDYG